MTHHNIKKVIISVLSVLMITCMCATAGFATEIDQPNNGETTVLYEGGAEHFVFIPESTDLFQNFKNVMPGDTLTQNIIVRNTTKNKKVAIYLRAEPVNEEYVDFLSYMNLKVTQDGQQVLSDAGAQYQGGLNQNVLLGTFTPGTGADLDVQLEVSIEMGNEHQLDYAEIVWIFTVEETEYNSPPTGDDFDLRPYVVVLAVALIVGTYLLARMRRRKNQQDMATSTMADVAADETHSESFENGSTFDDK